MRSRLCLSLFGLLAASVVGCSGPAESDPLELRVSAASVETVPSAPVQGRLGHAAVWTGTEMLVWGGVGQLAGESTRELSDGAAYDPVGRTWRVMSASPLSARTRMATVWAGDRWFVWGGSTPDSSSSGVLGDGALYDPVGDTWTMLPKAPLGQRAGARALWTGTEVLVFGGVTVPSTEQQRGDGAAYNPSSGTWRLIASAPLPDFYEFGAVWTGTELVVLAGTFDTVTHRPVGAAYEPVTDRWRSIADPPLKQGYAQDLGWDGSEVIAAYPVPASSDTTQGTTAAAYTPDTDSWRDLPRIPTEPSWGVPVWTGAAMAFWDAGPLVAPLSSPRARRGPPCLASMTLTESRRR